MASAAAKEAKKLKTEGGMVENTAREDEKAAAKSDNLSKRRPSLGEQPKSDNGHMAPQELSNIEDESINRISKAENGNENKLNLNEKVTHLRHLYIHKGAEKRRILKLWSRTQSLLGRTTKLNSHTQRSLCGAVLCFSIQLQEIDIRTGLELILKSSGFIQFYGHTSTQSSRHQLQTHCLRMCFLNGPT